MSTGYVMAGIRELWRSATTLGKDWRRGRAILGEVDALDPHERGRVLSEVGLTRTDLVQALRSPYHSCDLLAHGLDSVGVDVDAFYARHVLWHRDMERACAACPARSRCRRDLATGDFPRRYRHYCLNSDSIALLAAERPQA